MLARWYRAEHRHLPWRETSDPYRIWISEIMLQQTRAQAAIPYYERFLARFPDVNALASAREAEILAAWSGLGYYSRARNLRRAAVRIGAAGVFPATYEEIRALPGIGDYTAAAVARIAFGEPHAAVDGNVLRVIARLHNDAADIGTSQTRARFTALATQLLDRRSPGLFNQAMMELGATVCLPRQPECVRCPVSRFCGAYASGTARELPVKLRKGEARAIELTLAVVERHGDVLMWQRGPDSKRMAGFWELPEARELPPLAGAEAAGVFRHSITRHNYRVSVLRGGLHRAPSGFQWVSTEDGLPVSTMARKALALVRRMAPSRV